MTLVAPRGSLGRDGRPSRSTARPIRCR